LSIKKCYKLHGYIKKS